jgi:hypothetical protein
MKKVPRVGVFITIKKSVHKRLNRLVLTESTRTGVRASQGSVIEAALARSFPSKKEGIAL